MNDFKSIEDVLGVEEYVDTVKDLVINEYQEIARSTLMPIFENIKYQKSTPEFVYGFGYLRDDILRATKKVKQDAITIAKKFKELKVVVVISTNAQGHENFRLNRNNDWVKEILSEQLTNPEFNDIFSE